MDFWNMCIFFIFAKIFIMFISQHYSFIHIFYPQKCSVAKSLYSLATVPKIFVGE